MESSTGQDGKQRKLMRSASPADTGTLLPFQVLNGNEKKCRMRTEKKRFGVILQTAAFLDGISELASLDSRVYISFRTISVLMKKNRTGGVHRGYQEYDWE